MSKQNRAAVVALGMSVLGLSGCDRLASNLGIVAQQVEVQYAGAAATCDVYRVLDGTRRLYIVIERGDERCSIVE